MEPWASVPDMCAELDLDTDPTDTKGLRVELVARIASLNEDSPGNTHPDVSVLTQAIAYLDERTSSSTLEKPPKTDPPAVRSDAALAKQLPATFSRPQREQAALTAQRTLQPSRRTFVVQTVGLGAVGTAVTLVLALPNTLASHPVLKRIAPWTSTGKVRVVEVVVWLFMLASVVAAWLALWVRQQREAKLIMRFNDPDLQLEAVRSHFEENAIDGGAWLFPEDYRLELLRVATAKRWMSWHRIRQELGDDASANAAWLAQGKRLRDFERGLRTPLAAALKDAVDESIARWAAMGWLQLDERPFELVYKVIGELEL